MKYWNELNELESAIVRVNEFNNLFKLVVFGAENDIELKVLQSAIYTLEGAIDDINSELCEKFQTVWDHVKYEGFSADAVAEKATQEKPMCESGMIASYENKSTTLNFEKNEALKDLEKAIKTWYQANA